MKCQELSFSFASYNIVNINYEIHYYVDVFYKYLTAAAQAKWLTDSVFSHNINYSYLYS